MEGQGNTTCCSSDEVFASYAERQIIAAVNLTVSILGAFGNTLVIAAVMLSKKLRHATNMFVLNLSIADLLTCAWIVPIQSVAVLNEDRWPFPTALCEMAAFLFIICLGCSINSLACIAINRCVMVTQRKTTYDKVFAQKRTLAIIISTWLVPLCVTIIPVSSGYIKLGFEPKYSTCSWLLADSSPDFSVVLFATLLPVQLSSMVYSYIRVFVHIHAHARRVRHLDDPALNVAVVMEVQGRQGRQARQRPKRKNQLHAQVTTNLFCCMCTFVLCITPFNLSLVVPNTERFIPVAVAILIGNSCVNPMIYAAKHPHFRTVFRCIIRGRLDEIPGRISLRCCN